MSNAPLKTLSDDPRSNSPEASSTKTSENSVSETAKNLNTAFVSTQAVDDASAANDMRTLAESPAYRNIIAAVANLAKESSLSEVEAAQEIIHTFRKIDSVWKNFVISAGLNQLRNR